DTCILARQLIQPVTGPPVHLILLHESLAALPATYREALTHEIQRALDLQSASEIVRGGEHYLTPAGVNTATQPLHAMLRFYLQTNHSLQGLQGQLDARAMRSEPCRVQSQDCLQLCVNPLVFQVRQSASPSTSPWLAMGVVRSFWDFAAQD